MPDADQWRFLLRAVALLALMLALWWLVLLNPLLAGLRLTAELTLRLLPGGNSVSQVAIGPDRNWTFRVPAPAALVNRLRAQQMLGAAADSRVKIRSVRLEAPGRFPIIFTASFPLYWAIMLAAPGRRRLVRMALGTAVLAIFALLSIAVYAIQLAGGALQMTTSGLPKFLTASGIYLAQGVVPYLGPVLMAFSLNPELRGLILGGSGAPAAPPVVLPASPKRRKRR